MLLLIGFITAASAWFFYDGFIGYPKSNERAAEFIRFSDEGRVAEWPEFAFSRGWKREDPGPLKTDKEIRDQKMIGATGVAGALLMAWWFFLSCSRTLRAEDETIIDVDGKEVPMASVVALDYSKWEKKGIVYAFYQNDGVRKKLTLDDYKYAGAELIIKELEERLQTSQPDKAS